MTNLSILFPLLLSIISLIITLLIAKWSTYSSNRNKRIIRKRIHFYFFLCLVLIVFSIKFYKKYEKILHENEIQKATNECEELLKEANFQFEKSNYQESINIYHKILSWPDEKLVLFLDEKDIPRFKFNIQYYMATCYMIEIMTATPTYSISQAIDFYTDLLKNNKQFENEKNYCEAMVDLAYLYGYANDPIYTEPYSNIITQIINKFDTTKFIDKEEHKIEAFFMSRRAWVIANYYDNLFIETGKRNYTHLANEYYIESINFLNTYEKYMNNKATFKYYAMQIKSDAAHFFSFLGVMDHKNEYIQQSLDLYHQVIDLLDTKKDIIQYVCTQKQIGYCYYHLADLNDDDQNREIAYNYLKKLEMVVCYTLLYINEKYEKKDIYHNNALLIINEIQDQYYIFLNESQKECLQFFLSLLQKETISLDELSDTPIFLQ